MPLKGEYEPSKAQFVRDQVELYENSGGSQGTTLSVLVAREEDERLRDLPVVILTTLGAKSGKIRKTPVMRVEHAGSYAVVASMAGAPNHPVWYHNVVADPRVELQDARCARTCWHARSPGTRRPCGGLDPSRRSRTTRSTRRRQTARSRSSFWSRLPRSTDVTHFEAA
ncbi:hypothetical protein GCM10010313_00660 [Streptomyces violarus]|nr:hypothetical protein GCM10010313_00660 [Streptomyces violarus]